jgi:hemoglobin
MAETGIDDAMIERLVRGFYDQVREDALPPVFAARIANWRPSPSDVRFLVVRGLDERALPRPADAEAPDAAGRRPALDRWLALFEATAADLLPKAAAHFIRARRRIAESIEMGVATVNASCSRSERLRRRTRSGLRSRQGACRRRDPVPNSSIACMRSRCGIGPTLNCARKRIVAEDFVLEQDLQSTTCWGVADEMAPRSPVEVEIGP